MTLATDEFIRRFLIHVLTKGFHRIRHYGLLANGNRSENLHKSGCPVPTEWLFDASRDSAFAHSGRPFASARADADAQS